MPHVRFDVGRCIAYAYEVDSGIGALQVSANTGEGMEAWYEWRRNVRADQPSLVPA